MTWFIYRQELVLFHPKHKLLRFIHEHDSQTVQDGEDEDFKRYRRHAQQILATLRGVLKGLPEDAEITLLEDEGSDDDTLVEGHPAGEWTLKVRVPEGLEPRVLRAYLDYCDTTLHEEGWTSGSPPRFVLKALIDQLDNASGQPVLEFDLFDLSKKECSTTDKADLGRSTLLQLISALPIQPHWDLPGMFSDKSSPYNKGDKGDTLLPNVRYIELPVYAAQVRSFEPSDDCSPKQFPSSRLLGNRVRARLCYCDATRDISSTVFVRDADYYTHCHHPPDDESPLYRAYAVLVDALQGPLTKASASGAGDGFDKYSDMFYVAYPIKTALGRTHFWHVYFSSKPPGGALDELWASWWPLQQRVLDWPYLHAALAAELEQLDIGYAQGAILHDLKTAQTEPDALEVDQLVCSQGHMLFPASCFCTEKVKWKYESYFHSELGALGDVWKQENNNRASSPCSDGCTLVGRVRFRTNACESARSLNRTRFRPLLLRERYRRLVDQQQFLVREMVFAMERRRKLTALELEDWKRSCRRELLAMNVSTRNDLRSAIGDSSKKLEDIHIVEVEGQRFNGKSLIKKWHRGKDLDDKHARRELLLLISLNAHAMVSEFLELNPIKMLTHGGEDKLVNGWDQSRCVAQIDGFLSSISSLPECLNTTDRYVEALKALSAGAIRHLQAITGPLTAANARCASLDEDKNKLQIDKGEFKKLKGTDRKWTHVNDLSEVVKPFGNILTKVRLSLPKGYLSKILALSATVGSLADNNPPSVDTFRLPLHVDAEVATGEMPTFLFRNYLIFRWNDGNQIVDDLPDGSWADGTRGLLKNSLGQLSQELQDIGKCFIGTGEGTRRFRELHERQLMNGPVVESDIWPEISADQAKFVSSEFDSAQCQNAVTQALVGTKNILMVVFESWYYEKVKGE